MDENRLIEDGILSREEISRIRKMEDERPFSLYWELRTILYLGVLLLTTGIGILVYKNIDTIGHQIILAVIAIACGGCFYYVFRNRKPYSHVQVKYESPYFDYIVLLGCLLLGIFMGYLQVQYQVAGIRWGIITFLPTVVYLYVAYMFDHKGVLSLGLAGLAATVGINVTPLELLTHNDFSSNRLMWAAIILGVFLKLWAEWSDRKNIKTHFSFIYNNFAANLLFVGCLSGLFMKTAELWFFFLLIGICVLFIMYAKQHQSFLFLLLSALYGYVGFTYTFFKFLTDINIEDISLFSIGFMYVIVSCVGIVVFFMRYKKILKPKDDSIQL
jgi:hypothetical protein